MLSGSWVRCVASVWTTPLFWGCHAKRLPPRYFDAHGNTSTHSSLVKDVAKGVGSAAGPQGG